MPGSGMPRGRGQNLEAEAREFRGRGQKLEAKAEAKFLASRPVWPRGFNICGTLQYNYTTSICTDSVNTVLLIAATDRPC